MDERKLKILAAVVDEYILTGEPVGSKAISKCPDINVSSATIRNDMAILEQLGYLEQPHTSAGRIPTFNGYRLYIDKLMTIKRLSADERQRLDSMLDYQTNLTEESLIQTASQALAELTQCAAVVTNLAPKFSIISKVEVIPTGKRIYVILLITSNGSIKNRACRLEFDLNDEQLQYFTNYIKSSLEGISLESLSEEKMQEIMTAMGTYMMTLSPLLQGIYELSKDMLQKQYTINGTTNLLSCNEFDKTDIINFLEHKNDFVQLLDDSFSGIHVMFSQENNNYIISNSSMIMGQYQKDNQTFGSLGIIGPMRLNYSKLIPYIEYFTEKMSDILSKNDNDNNNNNNK